MATEQEILSGLAEIVNEVAGVPVADVQPSKSFIDDLDIDSLSMVEVVVAAEEKFDVKIPDDDVKDLSTVGDAVSYIAKAGANLDRLKDLDGKKVGIVAGSSTEKALEAAATRVFAKPVIVHVKDHDEGFKAMQDGKIDAYASDRIILFGLVVKANADLKNYFLLVDLYSYEPYGLMMRRDPDFRLAVDRQLARLYRSGEIVKIFGRWFGALGEPPDLLKAMFILNSYPE